MVQVREYKPCFKQFVGENVNAIKSAKSLHWIRSEAVYSSFISSRPKAIWLLSKVVKSLNLRSARP
jgi:hypothetical protein